MTGEQHRLRGPLVWLLIIYFECSECKSSYFIHIQKEWSLIWFVLEKAESLPPEQRKEYAEQVGFVSNERMVVLI
jgi:hypothetical protein